MAPQLRASSVVCFDQPKKLIETGVSAPSNWAFIVESGGSGGWAPDPAVSRGAEVLIFDPRPDDPPSFFSYHADGEVQLHLELGADYDPAGAQPDLLRPALEEAGAIAPQDSIDDMLGMDEELSTHEQQRRTLTAIGAHFGLSLPQETIESRRLPDTGHGWRRHSTANQPDDQGDRPHPTARRLQEPEWRRPNAQRAGRGAMSCADGWPEVAVAPARSRSPSKPKPCSGVVGSRWYVAATDHHAGSGDRWLGADAGANRTRRAENSVPYGWISLFP
ncbi:DUF6461 domain-containing protein [Streptomyces sp. NPDC029674]|uniref:DUF6461 domain-containing protein n=1 Tax=Streptomyces sp. NPDC029674 TaxID=3365297 RepID=UPI003850A372